MSLVLYNTLSGKKEKFVPGDKDNVKLYLCGPTVYSFLHIGNFRGPITFNLLRNWMEHTGYKVNFIYNYTDVDDKIIESANEEGVESSIISERYIKEFETDFNALGLRKHDQNPRVTEHIPDVIKIVETLVEKKHAYVVEGEVFYSIKTFENYGHLSKNNLDDLQAGQRVEVDTKKQDPLDFVLWKPAKEGEPAWDSPWGKGRPGWHIECSAMIRSLLGETIDIHGGGVDLTFPHHECEIAQSEGASGKQYCRYWMHNAFINMGDEKMSKSLGNVMTCRNFCEKYSPEILKYLMLSAHYRSTTSMSEDKIFQTISALDRIYTAKQLSMDVISQIEGDATVESGFKKKLEVLDGKIKKSLNDDLNSAEFISFVFEAVREFNSLGFKNKKWNAVHKGNCDYFLNWLNTYGAMSALFAEEPSVILNRLDEIMIAEKEIDIKTVEELVQKRNQARDDKDWALSDKMRDELTAMGIELMDGSGKGWAVKK